MVATPPQDGHSRTRSIRRDLVPRTSRQAAIPAADVSDQEAHILLNEVPPEDVILFDDVFDDDIHVRFTQHLLASESLFWKDLAR